MTQQPALWKALTGACTTGAVALGGAFLHLPDSFAYSHPRLAALVLPGGLSLAILALTFAVLAFVVDTARARWVVLPAGGYLALLLVAIPALLYRPLSVDRLTAYAFVQWNFKAERNFDEEPGLDWEEDWEEVWDDLQARAQASLETGNTDWLAGRAGKLFAHGHLLVGDKGQTCTLQEMAITYDLRDVISFQPAVVATIKKVLIRNESDVPLDSVRFELTSEVDITPPVPVRGVRPGMSEVEYGDQTGSHRTAYVTIKRLEPNDPAVATATLHASVELVRSMWESGLPATLAGRPSLVTAESRKGRFEGDTVSAAQFFDVAAWEAEAMNLRDVYGQPDVGAIINEDLERSSMVQLRDGVRPKIARLRERGESGSWVCKTGGGPFLESPAASRAVWSRGDLPDPDRSGEEGTPD